MMLIEIFDEVLDYQGPIVNGGLVMYTFKVEDLHYIVKFLDVKTKFIDYEFENLISANEEPPENVVEISYGINLGYKVEMGVSGTGNSIQVFSTVLDIIKTQLNKMNYRFIVFSAKEDSRQKMYDRLARLIANNTQMKLADTFNDEHGKNYILQGKM